MSSVLSLMGGLGLFLFGMKFMSDALEKAAGAKLRNALDIMTKNRFIGMLVGIVFTAIIQSSSATTIMVVSFVNAGLMSLIQAAGVIMGANIGTTVTSQLVAFDLSKFAPLFIFIGAMMTIFCKKPMIRKIGEVFLGFGILFFGLVTMSGAMRIFEGNPQITKVLSSLTNPFLAILVGFLLTAVLQGSSVSVSIILIMATQGLLGLPFCLFTILGCNIGSCTTPLIASLGARKSAKRAALIHFLFNIFGAVIIAIILAIWMEPIVGAIEKISGENIGRSVANAHTFFKIFQVIILFPFANGLVKLTYLIVPGKDRKTEDFEVKYIGKDAVFSPTTAVVQAEKELIRMGELAAENVSRAMDCLITLNEDKINQVYQVEESIDFLNHEITNYLVKVNQMTLPVTDANRLGSLFHVVNDMERIGDFAENFADAAKMRIKDGVQFSKKSQKEMSEMLDMVKEILKYSLEMFYEKNQEHLQEILELENQIDEKERQLQRSHIKRLTKGKCSPEAGMIFLEVASGLERIADHGINIACSILKEEPLTD